jgi:hypothetical protein
MAFLEISSVDGRGVGDMGETEHIAVAGGGARSATPPLGPAPKPASTTRRPGHIRVTEAARPFWDQWFGNPSRGHASGERPRQAVAGPVSRSRR